MLKPSLDYSDRDFDSLHVRARQLIVAAFPEWDDDSIADFGNILVDLFCFIGDVDAFYQNKQARETRWTQAQQRKNLTALMKMIGYVPTGATAATVLQTFTLAAAAIAPVRLPAGTKVSTLEVTSPLRYQLLEDLVLPAGVTTATATVEQSEYESGTFASLGTSNQAFLLTRSPYLPNSLSISAADGAYVQVKNFLNSKGTDQHFTVVIDEGDRARVTFGNGVQGSIPTGLIRANYKTGGGAGGAVEAGALQKLEGSFNDDFGNLATVTTTNTLRSSQGYDRQPSASIRQLAPESLHVSDRTVGRGDYEVVAKKRPDLVSRALMLTNTEDPAILPNAGFLFLVPPGAGDLPSTTIDVVTALFVTFPYAPSFFLTIQAANYLVVNIIARVYLAKGAVPAATKTATLKSISTFFEDRISDETSNDFGADNPTIDFGWKLQDVNGVPLGSLAASDIENAIRDTAGILKVDPNANGLLLNGKRADIAIGLRQFPKLGTVTLIDGNTGLSL